MRPFVIVGSGRSGTGYVSAVLREIGIECAHEHVFDDAVALGMRPPSWKRKTSDGSYREWDADASWLAVPRLPMLGVPTVLVLRHPLAVVRSQVELGFFRGDRDDRTYSKVVRKFRPEVYAETTEHDRALAQWITWNVAAVAHADLVFRLEDFDSDDLWEICDLAGHRPSVDLPGALSRVSRDTNAKASLKRGSYLATWDDHRPALRDLAQGLARMWGYEL